MTTLRTAVPAVFILLISLVGTPAGAQTAPDYVVVDPTFDALDGATAFAGTLTVDGADSGYRIEVPDDWNGSLVLYAHGFVGPQIAELVVQDPPLRELFIQQGYAWAASSYSANGYVIDESVEETDALRSQFADLTGLDAPQSTIVHGFSMGGHITGVAIERRPGAYVGALPACGVMADQALFDYFADVNLVAGALAGVDVPVPGNLSFLAGPAQQISATLGLQTGLATPAGVQYAAVVEALSGGERPTFEQSLAFWNVAAAVDPGEGPTIPFLQALYGRALSMGLETPTGAAAAYDNTNTIYGFAGGTSAEPSTQAQMLNAAVLRVEGNGATVVPAINGTPQIPVLSIHNTGDLFVPLFNERVYAEEVAANGLSDNLVQRTVRAAGHCDFTGVELATAFGDLVSWIATGERPDGEDLLDSSVVADRDLGCGFTSETREGMPECAPATHLVLGGQDAVGTSIAVSGLRPAAPTVVIARDDVYADGLTGSALAGALDSPILLNPSTGLDPRIADEVTRLSTTEAVLLGGSAALSPAVADDLAALDITVRRLSGPDRFGTAAAVAAEVTTVAGPPAAVFLASGRGFADSVSVAAVAAFLKQPILLTEPTFLPSETQQAMDSLGTPPVLVLGGTAVINDEVAGDALRLAGPNRYGTSDEVVDYARNAGMRINRPAIVTGESFADALITGPTAAGAGQVMIMVDGDDLAGSSHSTVETIEEIGPMVDFLIVVRTGQAVSDGSVDALTAAVNTGATVDAGAGMVTARVTGTVDEVVAGIQDRIEDAPPMLVTVIDHQANAEGAGLELPATTLLIFGAPAVGTPLMQSQRTAGIDLPQKIMVWADDEGTNVTYTHPDYLAARHGLSDVDNQLDMIATLLPSLAGIDAPAAPASDVAIGAGLVTVDVAGTVQEAVAAITERIESAPPTLLASVDHQANAEDVGLELPPTTLLILGAPAVGTPLMQSARTVGIDLPQKLLVWADDSGTHVTYNTPGYLQARHGLTGVDAQLDMIGNLLPMLATG